MKNIAMGKVYNPVSTETYWCKTWKDNNVFKAENKPGHPSFSVLLVPPRETGNPHMDHALTFTITDIITRRKRMQGFNTLYLPGVDRTGNVAHAASRLGLALDWDRPLFTPADDMQNTAAGVFVQLSREGYIYRDDYRGGVDFRRDGQTMAEPTVSKQWFLKTAGIAKAAVEAVEKGKIIFIPELAKNEYFRWMGNIREWRISRQLPDGDRIPVYYCGDCRCLMVQVEAPGKCHRCASTSITQDPDILDPRFSAALWPVVALGWRDPSPDFKDFFPASLITAFPDSIAFQVAPMVMMGIHIGKDVPFREVFIHGRIRDGKVRAMGTPPNGAGDPLLDIIGATGADALRFTLATLVVPGRDISFSRDRAKGYKAFANKIWNAARRVLANLKDEDLAYENFGAGNLSVDFAKITAADRWILNGLNNTVVKVNDLLDAYKIHKAANVIYLFFRREFCNWYLEFSRCDMDKPGSRKTLGFTLSRLLQLLHPFMPFITEEIYHRFNPGENRFLILTAFPAFSSHLAFPGEFADIEVLKKVIKETRKVRWVNGIHPKSKMVVFLKTESGKEKKVLEKNKRYFDSLAGSSGTQVVTDFSGLPGGFKGSCPNWEILLPLESDERKREVLARLEKEAQILDSRVAALEDKLAGNGVTGKDPGQVKMDFKRSLRADLNRRDRIRKTINDLS